MALERWHSIQLGTLWLTQGNTSDGAPIINEIEGLGVLKRGRTGQVNIAIDGTAWKQRFGVKGAPLGISFNLMEGDDFESLVTVLNNCDSGSDIAFRIVGDTGTYSGTATTADEYLDFDSTYLNGKIAGVKVALIIVSQNFVPSAGTVSITGSNLTLTAG